MLITFEDMMNLAIAGEDEDGNVRFRARVEDCSKEEMKDLIALDDSYFPIYGFHIIVNYDELKKAYEAAK